MISGLSGLLRLLRLSGLLGLSSLYFCSGRIYATFKLCDKSHRYSFPLGEGPPSGTLKGDKGGLRK